MYTNVYLIRHAQVDYIPDDFKRPLSEKGKSDALKLTEAFREYNVTRVISSPYLRAVDTVSGIAKDKGIQIETVEDFRERKICDEHIEDFAEFTKRQWQDFDYSMENGESLNEVQKRGIEALESVLLEHKGEDIVIGTHGTILAAILNYFDKKYDYEFWKAMKMPDVFRLVFKDGKIYSIENILL